MRSRFRLAVLVAPLMVVLTVWLGFTVTATFVLTDQSLPEIAEGARHLFPFVLFFGLLPAYAGTLLALPIYDALERRNRLRPTYVIGAAALIGLLLIPPVWGIFFNSVVAALVFVPTALAAGATGGATFWCLSGGAPRNERSGTSVTD